MTWLSRNLYKLGTGDWMTQNFPAVNSVDNDHVSDVVGNKTDTVAGNSLVALIKQIVATTVVLKESKLDPTLADGVVVTSSATAWTLGAAVNIPAVRHPEGDTQNPGGTITQIPCNAHGFHIGQVVTIAGSESNNGAKTILAVNANSFDFDDGSYNDECFDGDETISLPPIPNDFNIKYLSIENLSANAVYEIVLYDDGVEIGRAVCTKNAAQDGTVNIPILTPVIGANSIITAKCATNNAVADTVTIRIVYHVY
ncbi:unnamed protein product [marine sediment metagenome]|uniref:Uncharacterized protein n=2 Tax=marine sediment metagenome TaxID=412755 RepID=X1J9W8_9ZZZZ